jgi:antitoxin VapB
LVIETRQQWLLGGSDVHTEPAVSEVADTTEMFYNGRKKGIDSSMHLNIKNHEAHALAARLAKITGESISGAVTEAIRQRLERESRQRSCDALQKELLAIGRRCAAYGRRDKRAHGDFLYDERGLPRR